MKGSDPLGAKASVLTGDVGGSDPFMPWERPLGAVARGGTTTFRVWAPRARSLVLRLHGDDVELEDQGYGVFEVEAEAEHGDNYFYVVDGEQLPDPCSRWQPDGLRGPSRVFEPRVADDFAPAALGEQVLYELHVGTFTRDGTFDAAIPHLQGLAELGVTTIELMPVAEFPGRHGWGYDGVYLSAAQSSYGGPEALQRLVDAAHAAGLAVVLDVVYNHLGASGVKAIEAFGPYFTDKYETFWGKAINYDDEDSDPVREWVCQSAVGWVRNFHVDGLRLDAIHAIFDARPEHIVAEVARRVHAERSDALVIAESGMNDPKVVRDPSRGGFGCDAVWADDFHHALRVLLTGDRDGYYQDFGRVAQLAKAYRRPHVHDGGYSAFRRRRFGAPADDVPPERFVVFCQDHDQVGNRAYGDRLPEGAQPLAALCTLLAPFTPMLFMGEEYGERAPFQFFSDHIDEKIVVATREGRRREFAAFAEFGDEIPDPQSPATFERSKLTRDVNPAMAALYGALLLARRELPPGDADAIDFDEDERWLRVRRGHAEIVCNFADRATRVPCSGTEVVVGTHAGRVEDGAIELEPLAGALIR
ncbi:MAG: malto-oligosyltrehalose trehalohydrolase [Thermoleophilaceae bacterium]